MIDRRSISSVRVFVAKCFTVGVSGPTFDGVPEPTSRRRDTARMGEGDTPAAPIVVSASRRLYVAVSQLLHACTGESLDDSIGLPST